MLKVLLCSFIGFQTAKPSTGPYSCNKKPDPWYELPLSECNNIRSNWMDSRHPSQCSKNKHGTWQEKQREINNFSFSFFISVSFVSFLWNTESSIFEVWCSNILESFFFIIILFSIAFLRYCEPWTHTLKKEWRMTRNTLWVSNSCLRNVFLNISNTSNSELISK